MSSPSNSCATKFGDGFRIVIKQQAKARLIWDRRQWPSGLVDQGKATRGVWRLLPFQNGSLTGRRGSSRSLGLSLGLKAVARGFSLSETASKGGLSSHKL